MFFSFATAVSAQGTAASLAHAVDAHYNALHTLEARFTERYQAPGYDRTESGTLLLEHTAGRAPGRMRFSYDAPAGKLFVVNGDEAITYTPGDATATRVPARQLADFRSPLGLLLGRTHLDRELRDITAAAQAPGVYTLTGVPRGPIAKQIRQVQLAVIAGGVIQQLRLANEDGSTLTFTFSEQKENVPTAGTSFTFAPPPGVSIVDAPASE